MSGDQALKQLEQKAFREFEQDGLMEILVAGILLIGGVVVTRPFLVWLYGLFFFLPATLRALRRRLTYPRVGYAELVEEEPRRHYRGMAGVTLLVFSLWAVALVLTGHATDASYWRQSVPAPAGFLLACGMHYVYSRSGMLRHQIYALLSVVSGVGFSMLEFERPYAGVGYWLHALALVFLASGTVLLLRFLRSMPAAATEGADGGR